MISVMLDPTSQKEICEEGTGHAALRRALAPCLARPIRHLHLGLQPAFHIQQDPALVGVVPQGLEQQGVIDVIEVVLDTLPISKSFRSRLQSRGRPIRWLARPYRS